MPNRSAVLREAWSTGELRADVVARREEWARKQGGAKENKPRKRSWLSVLVRVLGCPCWREF